ncbi:MAG: hypothetical protein IPM57_03495 [Oligoflexia bacterium]|nr:hypothetical protein [Oligoflexia bacterium]
MRKNTYLLGVLVLALTLGACKKQEKFETTADSVASFKVAAQGTWTSECTTYFAVNTPGSSAAVRLKPNADGTLDVRLVTYVNSSNCGQSANNQIEITDIIYNYQISGMDSKEEALVLISAQDQNIDGLISGGFKVKYVDEDKIKILISPLDGIYQSNGQQQKINPNVLKNKALFLNRQI